MILRDAASVTDLDAAGILKAEIVSEIGSKPLYLITQGLAGSGKTHGLLCLHAFLKCYGLANNCIRFAAYMGSAVTCLPKGATTLHQLCGLARGRARKISQADKDNFQGTCLLIIDEYSTVGLSFLHTVSERLMLLTGSPLPFGGISVVLNGDLFQLSPPGDSALWTLITSASAADSALGKLLFTTCFTRAIVMEPEVTRRQSEDPAFASLLNRLRLGELTTQDVDLINSRYEASTPPTAAEQPPRRVAVLCSDNKTRSAINDYASAAAAAAGTTVYRINASIKPTKRGAAPYTESYVSGLRKLLDKTTAFCPLQLDLYIGASVVVSQNLATSLGVANGTVAKVSRILFDATCTFANEIVTLNADMVQVSVASQMPLAVVIRIAPDATPSATYIGLTKGEFPVCTPSSRSIQIVLPSRRFTISTNALPLCLATALTGHKAQGETLDGAVIPSLERVTLMWLYVVLSRVRHRCSQWSPVASAAHPASRVALLHTPPRSRTLSHTITSTQLSRCDALIN